MVQTYDRIQAAFPGNQIPAEVVIERGDASDVELTIAVHNLAQARSRRATWSSRRSRSSSAPITRVAVVSVPIVGDGTDDASYAALAELRDEIIPATVGAAARDWRRTSPATPRARRTSTT